MRRPIALILLTILLPLAAHARKPDDFSLSITLTRGERSRDSHSQTTRITLKERELIYEKSYSGFRGGARSAPVKKRFKIRGEDLEQLKKMVRESNLPDSFELSLTNEESGVRRYFELALNLNLDGKKSSIEISGPRNATQIKEKDVYLKTNALVDAVYRLMVEQDKEIGYENRDLIQ